MLVKRAVKRELGTSSKFPFPGASEAASVLPNVISCSAVISACGTGQHWQQALVTLTVMRQTAVLPSVISYSAVTAVINASEKGQQWHQALCLLASMQQTGVLRNVISYSAVFSACEKCQPWQP